MHLRGSLKKGICLLCSVVVFSLILAVDAYAAHSHIANKHVYFGSVMSETVIEIQNDNNAPGWASGMFSTTYEVTYYSIKCHKTCECGYIQNDEVHSLGATQRKIG